MKKLSACLLIIMMLILPSCKRSSANITAADLLRAPFSCSMDFKIVSTEFSGKFSKLSDSELDFQITEPESVSGLNFHKTKDNVTISINGIGISVATEKLPATAVSDILFTLYEDDFSKTSVDLRDNILYLTKDINEDSIIVEFDSKTLVPQKLYTKSGSLEIKYSDYKLI